MMEVSQGAEGGAGIENVGRVVMSQGRAHPSGDTAQAVQPVCLGSDLSFVAPVKLCDPKQSLNLSVSQQPEKENL